ncbi:hypothetical protein GHI93_07915 [Lactococcus hircilactis]|uniref:Immunity protein n=1 Tax=Lactococcus hircilactis TaxID=1494462 RepID=A0A7X2D0G7_9LACT|nr:hypothetical protein [Lactococcus hircilactis]MQW39849.1 hypothetical protein [Lactococcus hircilactis]
MVFRIIGIILLLLAIWQFVQARNGWQVYKNKSQRTDNALRVYGFAYSFFIALLLVVLGLSALLGVFS